MRSSYANRSKSMSARMEQGEQYEREHVHDVYEQIASHFSSTRYRPWPIVERFLKSLPDGSVGLDVGCGNGKYLAVNSDIFMVASDRSSNLIAIAAQHEPHSAIVSDILELPHHRESFDFAISIAVVHHLSTVERRVEAVRSILEPLRQGGQALIYVWALEQESSRRGWSEKDEQDVMVPWVIRGSKKPLKGVRAARDADGATHENEDKVFHRYYHLYSKGELERDIGNAGGVVLESGYEKDNWWAIAVKHAA